VFAVTAAARDAAFAFIVVTTASIAGLSPVGLAAAISAAIVDRSVRTLCVTVVWAATAACRLASELVVDADMAAISFLMAASVAWMEARAARVPNIAAIWRRAGRKGRHGIVSSHRSPPGPTTRCCTVSHVRHLRTSPNSVQSWPNARHHKTRTDWVSMAAQWRAVIRRSYQIGAMVSVR